MSIDVLQEKIRKLKNPSVIDFTFGLEQIPPHLQQLFPEASEAYAVCCAELLDGLQGVVPAVRFSISRFALFGAEGLQHLQRLLAKAKHLGFYVFLDGTLNLSGPMAAMSAQTLFSEESPWQFDALITSAYMGSDGLRPFTEAVKDTKKSVFGVVRTGNKSAAELQDLMAGPRLVHAAAADMVNRLGEPMPQKCGYNQIGAVAGANSADSLRTLRSKYSRLFLLIDGFDAPNANAKNCSYAFDKLGHGAVACAGSYVIGAWQQVDYSDGTDYLRHAKEAAERMKKNITKYVTVF